MDKAVIDRGWILASLRQNCILAMAVDEDGEPAPTFNGSVANRALELLGKELGMFRDTIDHNFHWNGDPRQLDEQQLATMIAVLEQIAASDQALAIETTAQPVS